MMKSVLKSGARYLGIPTPIPIVEVLLTPPLVQLKLKVIERKYATPPVENTANQSNQSSLNPVTSKTPYQRLTPNEYMKESMKKLISENRKDIDSMNWAKLRDEATKSMKFLKEDTFQTMLMQNLTANNRLDLAKNYLNYLEETSKPHFMTLGHYVALCGKNNAETELFTHLEKIPKQFYVSIELCKLIISGLHRTSRWRDCLSILRQHSQLYEGVNSGMWSKVAIAAFKNHDFELGIKMLEEIYSGNSLPQENITRDWLETISGYDLNEKTEKLRQFLNFAREKELTLPLESAEILKNIFMNDLKKRGDIIQINREDTHCPSCKMELESLQITNAEFKTLQEEMLKVLIMGPNVYLNSSPEEMDHFRNFLKRAKPYNLVVDGLNMAYINIFDKQRLLKMVLFLKNQFRNPSILLIGRKHMTNWNTVKEIRKFAQVFLTDNQSKDDPFLLYSTIAGGPRTYFVSIDMMRDHSFKFSENKPMRDLFDRWIKSHQISIENNADGITFIRPSSIETRCQGTIDSDHLHFPTSEQDVKKLSRLWLCLKK